MFDSSCFCLTIQTNHAWEQQFSTSACSRITQASDLTDMKKSPGIWISNNFPGDTNAAGQGATFWASSLEFPSSAYHQIKLLESGLMTCKFLGWNIHFQMRKIRINEIKELAQSLLTNWLTLENPSNTFGAGDKLSWFSFLNVGFGNK